MKNKIFLSTIVTIVSFNLIGCGCGTPNVEETTEMENVVEMEFEEEPTEVIVEEMEDYADSITEVEGGDGEEVIEETTEEVVEETKEVVEEEAFEPYMMYTNTNCNVRADASKTSELVGTCAINTEVKVIGIKGDWSNVEYNGLSAYIKSSLLSKTKTEVKTTSDSGNGGIQSQPSNPAPSGGGAGTVAGGDPFGDWNPNSGGSGGTIGGTGGHSGGGFGGAY